MGGFCGVIAKDDCVTDLFFGTDYHSHLGTHRGGMAVLGESGFKRSIHNIQNAQFRSKFERDVTQFAGPVGIGCISDTDPQPLVMVSKLGTFALVTVGIINNQKAIVDELLRANGTQLQFSTTSGMVGVTEIVSALIATKDTLLEGIRYVQERVKGSMSLLVVTEDGRLICARDKWGRTPIVVGKKDGSMIALMESCALPNLGYTHVRDLGPCEIAELTADGEVKTLSAPQKKMAICSFLWVYYGYPASYYEGRNVEMVRYRCGSALAKRNPTDIDAACGIPDSGTSHALGYAQEAGVKFARPFVKYTPTWARSFMPQEQKQRENVASMKLITIEGLIKDRRLAFCDDSIVRGTQLPKQAANLYSLGCKEMHVRIACPPLVYPCQFLNFSRSKSVYDLITRRYIRGHEGENCANPEVLEKYSNPDTPEYARMVEYIREKLNLTSLAFQRVDDLIQAIGLPEDQVCTYCWTGKDHALTGDCAHVCSSCPHACGQ